MDNYLEEIAIYVKVAQLGGFTAAAKALNIPVSTVSTRVSTLEANLGVTLLQRTTRKVKMTAAGQVFLERCHDGLLAIKNARDEISDKSTQARGRLRMTASVDFAHGPLAPLIKTFHERYPDVEVDLVVTNRRVDLIEEGIDLGIRMGELQDSTLMVRKKNYGSTALWASSSYLQKQGTPKHPRELAHHHFIGFMPLKNLGLSLQRQNESCPIRLNSSLWVDDLETAKTLAIEGLGVSILPDIVVSNQDRRKNLVPLLPTWKTGHQMTANFIYPAQKFVAPNVRRFLEIVF